ncbi:short chain dehydrogenase [Corallococcus sp. H22C18031201]|nr:short chain dehydrogenase [Corallococcus sp. H22C18031201]
MDFFEGKRVVITGASSGIGAELATQLAAKKARLTLAARNLERLQEVANACQKAGAAALAVRADVSREEDCRALMKQAVKFGGGLDLAILNAGISMYSRFEDIRDLSIFNTLMQTNFMGAVYCTRYALPALKESKGRLVVVSSLGGKTGLPTRSAYAASKHALHGFFESLRGELHASGVRITLVCPGPVLTEVRQRALSSDGTALGHTSIDESGSMSAAECARRILEATRKGKREEIMTVAGKVGQYARLFVPGVIDRIVRKRVGL